MTDKGSIFAAGSRRGFLAGLGSALLVGACSTPNIDRAYTPSAATGKGVVFGSITHNGLTATYEVQYRKQGGGGEGRFAIGEGLALLPIPSHGDIRERGLRGELFAAELAEGDYEVVGWHVASGYAHIRPTNDFSVRFHVTAGGAVYLGNFHFTRLSHLGLTTTNVDVACKDEFERDQKLLAGKYPAFAQVKLDSAIEKGKTYEHLGVAANTVITIPVFLPMR